MGAGGEGQLPRTGLVCHRFSGHDTGPHLLITGGVHGDEFEPIVAIRRLISIFSGESEQQKSWVGKE